MRLINKITAQPSQSFQIPTDSGVLATITLNYRPAIQMWFVDVELGDKVVYGIRVDTNTNILWQFKNKFEFGLLVTTDEKLEPNLINSFSSAKSHMYYLSMSDIEQLEDAFIEAKG